MDIIENIISIDSQLNDVNKYTAVIIEITKHNALSFVLQQFFDNLTDEWNFVIIHGNDNKTYLENILNLQFKDHIHRFQLIHLFVNEILKNIKKNNNYDYIWKYKGIYDYIPTETFLIFNTKSIILSENKHLINDFLDYDYVGAPWGNEFVGNGGLSIRKKSKMLQIIEVCDFNEQNEDEFFCFQDKVFLNRPSFEKARQFSVETVFHESPFGIHNCYNENYLSIENLNYLVNRYPVIKEFCSLNLVDNNNNISHKKFTLIYKTYRNDLEWLKYSLLSLQKFLDTENIFELIVYTHDLVYNDVQMLFSDIGMNIFVNYRIIPIHYNYHGYIKQMAVKANSYKDCKTEYVILLDSDLILKKQLNVSCFVKESGKIEWFYLNKNDDPHNDVFHVWKKAVQDSIKSEQNIHYMSNGFPFVFTRQSLEDAAKKFIEMHNCDYDAYCENRCGHENIRVEDSIGDIFNKLSKVWTEFEYLGFYCHTYSTDYTFTPTTYCKMKNQFQNPNVDSYFVQYWSHGGLNENIRNQIKLNNKKQKTVIQVFTQSVNNLKTDDVNNFWGLGDIIRGTIALFQLSKKHNFHLIVDIQLHPISKYFKFRTHEYSEYIRKNKDNISFIYPGTVENYIENNDNEIIYFLTNEFFHDEITQDCKDFIKNLLQPNLELETYIQDIIKSKPPPENYSILHCRLGDSFLVRNDDERGFDKIKETIFKYAEASDVLMSDSNSFKEDIMVKNPNIFLYHIRIAHLGVQMHSDYIKDTLFEFILATRSSNIKTYSVYGHLSGFVKIIHEIYDISIVRM